MNNSLGNIIESFMYLISYIEIFYKHYFKNIIDNLLNSYCYDNNDKIIFVKNNKLCKSIDCKTYTQDMLNDYDFAIFEHFGDEQKNHFYFENNDKFSIDDMKEKSMKFFIAAEISIENNEIINIDLNEINYNIVNNKLFKEKYIHFYMNDKNINISDYVINLVDNNCNIIKLTHNEYILLKSDTYEVKVN